MRKRILGSTNLEVTNLGFGGIPIQQVSEEEAIKVVQRCYDLGINYYDTARAYTVSEERIGKALEDVRNEVILATKTQALTKEGAVKDLKNSLNNLRTDHIDVYQLHNVSTEESWETISAPGGALEAFHEAKDQKKIRHIGITSHNVQLLQQIVKEGIFETVLVQLNYLAPEAEEKFLPLCKKMNIGVVIMKPFAGGALSNATTALKYVLANDDVDVVVPGMMRISEVEKNVSVTSEGHILTRSEKKLIGKDKKELGEKFCRACNYCQPCTQGIPIFSLLRVETDVKRMGLTLQKEKQLKEAAQKASECIECGTCETRCPYHLPIMELLKVKRKYIEELLEERG